MTTLFISDLHLEPGRPEITALFLGLLAGEARDAEALYILGDLFEYWIGDDAAGPLAEQVADGLRSLNQAGVPVCFMHGNRDFLLGPAYAERAGMELLPEAVRLDLYGEPTLLMHGDSLCIDDVAYQQFRTMVRDPLWQQQFLQMPQAQRQEMAREARDASKAHTGTSSMDIMDVNPGAVAEVMRKQGVRRLIHGHTHRPAVHDLEVDGTPAQRFVLSDWYTTGSVLRVTADGALQASLG